MIDYIKSFKRYIPTWIICLFMFFWIFGWTFLVSMILFIIQCFQVKKIKSEMKIVKNDYLEVKNEKNNYEFFQKKLESYELNIKTMQEKISKLNNLIKDKENKMEILSIENIKIIQEKEKEIDEISLKVSNLTNLVQDKENEINVLCLENKKIKDENYQLQKNVENNDKQEYELILYQGNYLVGRDIALGSYILSAHKNKTAYITLYPSMKKFREEEDEIILESFEGKYHISLTDNNTYLVVENADICKVKGFDIVEVQRKSEISSIKTELDGLIQEKNRLIEDTKKEYENEKSILNTELENIKKELENAKNELRILNNEIIKKYYNFSDYSEITSQECKDKLILLKQKEKDLRQNEADVIITPSARRTKKTEENIVRQMLRSFNAECDNIILNISLKNIDSSKRQIQKSFETINRLYLVDSAYLSDEFLKVKLEQATLMYTYELKRQEEKEIQKEIKEQMIEEAKAQREIEEQKKKIDKDLQQFTGEVNKLMKYLQKTQNDAEKELYTEKIRELEERIKELESNKENVTQREANAKAGFVYIISNIGSFGENIYKIGMTRRLEPMDRIKELSGASVPFEFDVHAMIFSEDAPALENELHKHFADKAVNKVNPRKEFFHVEIEEIEKIVKDKYNDTVQFHKIPLALEYRKSILE